MEFVLSPFPIVAFLFITLLIFAFFKGYQSTQTGDKAKKDKALLKELLERFDLEVPAELIEAENIAIKPIRSN